MSKTVISTTKLRTTKGEYTVVCDARLEELYFAGEETGKCEVILEDILIKNDDTGEVMFLRGLTGKSLEFLLHSLRSTPEVKDLLIERYEEKKAKKATKRKPRVKTD